MLSVITQRTFNKVESTLEYSVNLHFLFFDDDDPEKLGASEQNSVKVIILKNTYVNTVFPFFLSFIHMCSYLFHYEVWSVDWEHFIITIINKSLTNIIMFN